MYMLNLIRTERDSDGTHVFKLNKGLLFAKTPVNINVSRCAVPKLGLVPGNRYDFDIKLSYVNVCVKFFLGLKEVQMRAHDFKLYKLSHFDRKTANINVSLSAAPKLAFGTASRCYCDVN